MGELTFIGLGLHDEKGVTLRGLEDARAADVVFAELYTSTLAGASLESIERLVGRKIRLLDRADVEDGRAILDAAAGQRVAFLVGGDPMAATTHVDLRLRAAAAGIPTRIVHGASILTAAAGVLGLQIYKFGRTTTVPFPSAGFGPTSPLETILENHRMGLHSLVLLDLREDGTFLPAGDAVALLLQMAAKVGTAELGPRTFACALSRVGSRDGRAAAGPLGDLPARDLGRPPHCLVVPGNLHFLEKEALIVFAGAPRDLSEEPSRAPRGGRSSRT
jgi:diphthine synthase